MKSLSSVEQFILETLAYADIFAWPIAEKELFSQAQSQNLKLKTALNQLIREKKIACKNNYYFLYSRKGLVERRLQREKWAAGKMAIARKAAGWLKIIPSILLVGVSGGLAVGNVAEDDDIDFFIICRHGTLWTTRFWAILLLELLGQRRRPNDSKFKDKICLNMFVDEEGMAVPPAERDVYTAHEIRNLKLLWEREETYRKFLEANSWTYKSSKLKAQSSKPNAKFKTFSFELGFALCTLHFALAKFESPCRWLQMKYMRGRRTREKIEPHRLLFHPQDKRKEILKKYQQKLKALNL